MFCRFIKESPPPPPEKLSTSATVWLILEIDLGGLDQGHISDRFILLNLVYVAQNVNLSMIIAYAKYMLLNNMNIELLLISH